MNSSVDCEGIQRVRVEKCTFGMMTGFSKADSWVTMARELAMRGDRREMERAVKWKQIISNNVSIYIAVPPPCTDHCSPRS